MILDTIFPPICVHCDEKAKSSKFALCSTCFASLEMIHPKERCPKCFSEKEDTSYFCKKCRDYPLGLEGVAAVFESIGAFKSLFKEWKMCHRPNLAQGLAAFMALQLTELSWPSFDLIIPIPQTLLRKVSLGFNPSFLLAKELGKLLSIPVYSCLKKKIGYPLQTRLSWEERQKLSPFVFEYRRGVDITCKTILIVDDLIGTGATLKTAALHLKEGSPKALYGIGLCI